DPRVDEAAEPDLGPMPAPPGAGGAEQLGDGPHRQAERDASVAGDEPVQRAVAAAEAAADHLGHQAGMGEAAEAGVARARGLPGALRDGKADDAEVPRMAGLEETRLDRRQHGLGDHAVARAADDQGLAVLDLRRRLGGADRAYPAQ